MGHAVVHPKLTFITRINFSVTAVVQKNHLTGSLMKTQPKGIPNQTIKYLKTTAFELLNSVENDNNHPIRWKRPPNNHSLHKGNACHWSFPRSARWSCVNLLSWYYSDRRLFTGFAFAALIVWKLTVIRASSIAIIIARRKIQTLSIKAMWFAKLCSHSSKT